MAAFLYFQQLLERFVFSYGADDSQAQKLVLNYFLSEPLHFPARDGVDDSGHLIDGQDVPGEYFLPTQPTDDTAAVLHV